MHDELHAALARDQARVDQIDGLGRDGLEQALQHGPRDQLRVAPRDAAAHHHLHALDVVRLELHAEAPERLREGQERPLLRDGLAVADRHVHRVLDQLAVPERDDWPARRRRRR